MGSDKINFVHQPENRALRPKRAELYRQIEITGFQNLCLGIL